MSDALIPRVKVKDPSAILVYEMDWGTHWLAAAITIPSSTWTISGPDAALTKDQESTVAGGRSTRLRLSAGTVGARYFVTNRIVTSETPSQTDERTFELLIQNR